MAMTPEVLVLDEPAAGLDPVGRATIFASVEKYRKETGATVIIVSHSMEDMARICDNIVVMAGGKILMHGKTADVFARADILKDNGLDIPEISKLMILLRDKGMSFDDIPYTVSDAVKIIRKEISK
jgi:energy-coupling factor transport system ATP-binding protein